jgi:hypothetical protein
MAAIFVRWIVPACSSRCAHPGVIVPACSPAALTRSALTRCAHPLRSPGVLVPLGSPGLRA